MDTSVTGSKHARDTVRRLAIAGALGACCTIVPRTACAQSPAAPTTAALPGSTVQRTPAISVRAAAAFDVSPPLAGLRADGVEAAGAAADCASGATSCSLSRSSPDAHGAPGRAAARSIAVASTGIEQTSQGSRPPLVLLESFDGHGYGMVGPHGRGGGNNPSDNSLAVGPNHIMETVNSRIAVYSKKGALYERSGEVLSGPLSTNVIFAGFGGECERAPNGDTVVRYDQLADRWLVVMPLFRRAPRGPGEPPGPYGMCYAVSAGTNPLGSYHRYYFERELFPDYPRPAIWPDGYYVPTSTGDDVIEKHACVVERARMLQGLPAREQCIIIADVNFLNNADIDGFGLPPAGAPNIMMATGGTQLRDDFDDDGIYVWKFYVDWDDASKSRVTGPVKIAVAPYQYLCNGQLTRCVPQPDTDVRLDAQGDKLMQRLVYRNVGGRESIVAVHSVNAAAGGGGVRWYEFRLNDRHEPYLHQQGTYAPDGFYRWMASPAIDRRGNIGIGYSFGGTPHYAGQRFTGRLAGDPPGLLTFHETILAEGAAAQTSTLRWQDYVQTALDPTDQCTIWYVGDYLKPGASGYTTKIGAFRLPDCLRGTLSGATFFDVNRNGFREPNEPGLAGWRITHAGTPLPHGQHTPSADTLITDASGAYRVSVPVDPAYYGAYTVTSQRPTHPAWVGIERGTAYGIGRTVSLSGGAYTAQLAADEEVAQLGFGFACAVRNEGGTTAAHWLRRSGREQLRANEPRPGAQGRGPAAQGWRGIINVTRHLVAADGSRFNVSGSFDQAYDQLASWLRGDARRNAAYAASIQLATTALNVAYGTQDGNAAVHDPVTRDWAPVTTLLGRVSTAIAAQASAPAAVATYASLLRSLNTNNATVTPSSTTRCPPPFRR
jgi:hypothetical protein